MKIRKILAALVACAMLLSTLCFTVSAADGNVAKVGDTEYATIDEAIAAWTNGTTLTLLSDVTLSDVITLKSTEHHILKLGTYTMTAAPKCHAITFSVDGTGQTANLALEIYADETNPGGINAPGKSCIYTYRTNAQGQDRPLTRIYGGVFSGSYAIQHSNSNGTNAPVFEFYGGTYNASINTDRATTIFEGGTYNKNITLSVDSSSYARIEQGTFKYLPSTWSTLNGSKWAYGSAKNVYDVDVYVDAEGYYRVERNSNALPSVFEAYVPNAATGGLQYSKLATDGKIYYESADVAINSGKNTVLLVPYTENLIPAGNITVDMTEADFTGNVTIGANKTFTVKFDENNEYNGTVETVDGYGVKVTETVSGGVVTRKYTSYEIITADNAGAKVVDGDNVEYFKTLSEALAKCEGTSGKTAVMMKDDVRVSLPMNSKTSDITLDLNGYTLGVNSVGYSYYTDMTLRIVDNSEEKTGIVANDFLSNMQVNSNNKKHTVVVYGGTWPVDIENYVKNGETINFLAENHTVSYNASGTYSVIAVADIITLKFEEAVDANGNAIAPEEEKYYNIYLQVGAAEIINRLNSVDLTFKLTQKSGTNTYEIVEENKEIEINPVENSVTRYEFHFKGKNGVTTDTNEKILIGQVRFSGYGTFSFAVDAADTNVAHATTLHDNIVDTFVPGGKLADGTEVGTFDVSDGTGEVTIEAPTKDLTVNIAFPNAVNDNAIAYQDMKVVISGDDLAPVTIDLGEDAKKTAIEVADRTEAAYFADFVDGAYVVTVTDALTVNTSYDITVSGAGYRTARYTVRMTDNKTVNFWNNVKDAEAAVEDGKFYQTKNYLAGDIVKDNKINTYDLSAVVSYFGETGLSATNNKAYAKYDLNRDGFIDSKDVAIVLVSWGN